MANLKVYKEALGLSSLDEILQAFRDSLLDTNKSFSYFVDWQKIRRNVEGLNVEINILNSLIGSKNIKADLSKLLSEYPEVLHVFPLIIAVREQEIKLIRWKRGRIFKIRFSSPLSKMQPLISRRCEGI